MFIDVAERIQSVNPAAAKVLRTIAARRGEVPVEPVAPKKAAASKPKTVTS